MLKRISHLMFYLFFLLSSLGHICADEPSDTSPFSPLTLAQCYTLALRQSEDLAVNQEKITEAQARFQQALSTILPRISFSSSDKWQDVNSGSSLLRKTPEVKFTFSQPLFTGFKELAAMAGARAQKRQREYELMRAKELLFLDVTDAFYLFELYQEDTKILNKTRQALCERIEELKKRAALGKSRASEVVSAQVRLKRLEAELESNSNQFIVVQELLEFLTGIRVNAVREEDIAVIDALPEGEIIKKAQSRSDVKAAEEVFLKTQKDLLAAKAGFFPTVSLDGNQYLQRAGSSKDIDWDVTLKVAVPLFKGGENIANWKEAAAKSAAEELNLKGLKRKVILEIKRAADNWQSSLKKKALLNDALAAGEENYRLQSEDYRLNVVNNLDVLDALSELEDTHRDYISAQNESKRLYWQYQVAIGETVGK